ncbi:MAG: tetratricopeptide repeat protein [Psychrilyobacter sp.]|nr:tetratricopeptide repeat protein [Psychrilyobacter sp.]
MKDFLSKIYKLRKEKKLEEALEVSKEYLLQFGTADSYYQCAWSHDTLGLEKEAIPYYEKAIELGLAKEDLKGAILGLGSTYRCLGEYKKSENLFLRGIDEFNTNEFRVFYAMTLYNLKKFDQASEIMLKIIATTSKDKDILEYDKAILFYSDKLEEKF